MWKKDVYLRVHLQVSSTSWRTAHPCSAWPRPGTSSAVAACGPDSPLIVDALLSCHSSASFECAESASAIEDDTLTTGWPYTTYSISTQCIAVHVSVL